MKLYNSEVLIQNYLSDIKEYFLKEPNVQYEKSVKILTDDNLERKFRLIVRPNYYISLRSHFVPIHSVDSYIKSTIEIDSMFSDKLLSIAYRIETSTTGYYVEFAEEETPFLVGGHLLVGLYSNGESFNEFIMDTAGLNHNIPIDIIKDIFEDYSKLIPHITKIRDEMES